MTKTEARQHKDAGRVVVEIKNRDVHATHGMPVEAAERLASELTRVCEEVKRERE